MRRYINRPIHMRKKDAVVAILEVGGNGSLCDQMNSKPGIIVINTVMYIHISSAPSPVACYCQLSKTMDLTQDLHNAKPIYPEDKIRKLDQLWPI